MYKTGGEKLKGIIDRFEEDRVLLEIEGEGILVFDRELFPKNLEEGDIVQYIDNRFIVNEEETRQRKKHIDDLFNSLIDENKK